MKILFIPVASIIAALSLFSVGAFAATPPDTTTAGSSDASEVNTVCQIATAPTSSPNTTATATATTAAATATPIATTTTVNTTAGDDDVSNTAEDSTGQAIRACIAALHDDGRHGIGQTVSELAHEVKAERHADDGPVGADDDASPLVSVTPTATTPTTSVSIVTPATITQDRDEKPTPEHGNSRDGKHGHG